MAPPLKKLKLFDGHAATAEVDPAESKASPKSTGDKPEQQRRSLFVRSLPVTTTTQSLTDLFSASYPIKHATAVIDRDTKQCRGFGFVTFADAEDAVRAKQEFDGHVLEGKKLRLEIAEPRSRESEVSRPSGDLSKPKRTRPEKEVPKQQSRLIVRNLPWTIKSSDQLEKLFLSYGKVKKAYIPRKGAGLMAGFGFVVMRGKNNAEKALQGVNGREVDGRTLAVDWAVEKSTYEGLTKGDGDEDGLKDEDMANGASSGAEELQEHIQASETGSDLDGASDYDGVELESGSEASDEEDEVAGSPEGDEDTHVDRPDPKSTTLFVRNLPFTCTDEDLEDHFSRFGSVRYARIVMDPGTERSRGTGFVCFYKESDADSCLRAAPRRPPPTMAKDSKDMSAALPSTSVLQNEAADPSGEFTVDGRVLQVSRAVEKSEASRLSTEGLAHRNKRDKDKRRLYLLSEGTIPSNSRLYEKLSPSERTMREASAKQRKTLIEGNPSLHLSLTRLSVRNIPRSITSKDLKALAREAVVGFATDVKEGKRSRLSKEELARGGDEMDAAERARKKSGKGLVKQAKVVFEGASGSKVSEGSGAGRSRGYGFIEYYTHRPALMGLRWLNGHAIGYQVNGSADGGQKKLSREDVQDRKKRLIVEFAIENAQVVLRRNDRETKARERSKFVSESRAAAAADGLSNGQAAGASAANPRKSSKSKAGKGRPDSSRKRKRDGDAVQSPALKSAKQVSAKLPVDEKLAKRNQIIGRKRAMRKVRKGGKA